MSLQANEGYVVLESVDCSDANKGLVVSVFEYSNLTEGDIVHFNPYQVHKINHNNKEYLVVDENDILAYEVDDEPVDE